MVIQHSDLETYLNMVNTINSRDVTNKRNIIIDHNRNLVTIFISINDTKTIYTVSFYSIYRGLIDLSLGEVKIKVTCPAIREINTNDIKSISTGTLRGEISLENWVLDFSNLKYAPDFQGEFPDDPLDKIGYYAIVKDYLIENLHERGTILSKAERYLERIADLVFPDDEE